MCHEYVLLQEFGIITQERRPSVNKKNLINIVFSLSLNMYGMVSVKATHQ